MWHPHVHHHHVRAGAPDCVDPGGTVVGLGHHLDTRFGLQDHRDALADQRFVVDQHHGDHRSSSVLVAGPTVPSAGGAVLPAEGGGAVLPTEEGGAVLPAAAAGLSGPGAGSVATTRHPWAVVPALTVPSSSAARSCMPTTPRPPRS